MVKTVTIPNQRSFQYEKELVLIPREEYNALIRIKQKGISMVSITKGQKKAIAQSEGELQRDEYLTLNELESYLARPRSKTRR